MTTGKLTDLLEPHLPPHTHTPHRHHQMGTGEVSASWGSPEDELSRVCQVLSTGKELSERQLALFLLLQL